MSGFGLQTPRGTGTSGYLQKSVTEKKLSGFREKRDREALEQIRRQKRAKMSEARFEASAELRNFNSKREIEVKCMELRETLEEQDLSELEIDQKVKLLRQSLSGEKNKSESDSNNKEKQEKSSFGDEPSDEERSAESEEGIAAPSSAPASAPGTIKTSPEKASKLNTEPDEENSSEIEEKKPTFAYVPRYSKR